MMKWIVVIFTFFLSLCVSYEAISYEKPFHSPSNFDNPSVNQSQPISFLTAVRYSPENPFEFDFYFDFDFLPATISPALEIDLYRQISYFFTALTSSNQDIWVNLDPNTPQRILPRTIQNSELGNDLLQVDYKLKKFVTKALRPKHPIGEIFWKDMNRESDQFKLNNDETIAKHRFWVVPKSVRLERFDDILSLEDLLLSVRFEHKNSYKEMIRLDQRFYRLFEEHINTDQSFQILRQITQPVLLAQGMKKIYQIDVDLLRQLKSGILAYKNIEDQSETVFRNYLKLFDDETKYVFEKYLPDQQTWSVQQYVSGGVSLRTENVSKINLSKSGRSFDKKPSVRVFLQNDAPTSARKIVHLARENPVFPKIEYLFVDHQTVHYFWRAIKKKVETADILVLEYKNWDHIEDTLNRVSMGDLTPEQAESNLRAVNASVNRFMSLFLKIVHETKTTIKIAEDVHENKFHDINSHKNYEFNKYLSLGQWNYLINKVFLKLAHIWSAYQYLREADVFRYLKHLLSIESEKKVLLIYGPDHIWLSKLTPNTKSYQIIRPNIVIQNHHVDDWGALFKFIRGKAKDLTTEQQQYQPIAVHLLKHYLKPAVLQEIFKLDDNEIHKMQTKGYKQDLKNTLLEAIQNIRQFRISETIYRQILGNDLKIYHALMKKMFQENYIDKARLFQKKFYFRILQFRDSRFIDDKAFPLLNNLNNVDKSKIWTWLNFNEMLPTALVDFYHLFSDVPFYQDIIKQLVNDEVIFWEDSKLVLNLESLERNKFLLQMATLQFVENLFPGLDVLIEPNDSFYSQTVDWKIRYRDLGHTFGVTADDIVSYEKIKSKLEDKNSTFIKYLKSVNEIPEINETLSNEKVLEILNFLYKDENLIPNWLVYLKKTKAFSEKIRNNKNLMKFNFFKKIRSTKLLNDNEKRYILKQLIFVWDQWDSNTENQTNTMLLLNYFYSELKQVEDNLKDNQDNRISLFKQSQIINSDFLSIFFSGGFAKNLFYGIDEKQLINSQAKTLDKNISFNQDSPETIVSIDRMIEVLNETKTEAINLWHDWVANDFIDEKGHPTLKMQHLRYFFNMPDVVRGHPISRSKLLKLYPDLSFFDVFKLRKYWLENGLIETMNNRSQFIWSQKAERLYSLFKENYYDQIGLGMSNFIRDENFKSIFIDSSNRNLYRNFYDQLMSIVADNIEITINWESLLNNALIEKLLFDVSSDKYAWAENPNFDFNLAHSLVKKVTHDNISNLVKMFLTLRSFHIVKENIVKVKKSMSDTPIRAPIDFKEELNAFEKAGVLLRTPLSKDSFPYIPPNLKGEFLQKLRNDNILDDKNQIVFNSIKWPEEVSTWLERKKLRHTFERFEKGDDSYKNILSENLFFNSDDKKYFISLLKEYQLLKQKNKDQTRNVYKLEFNSFKFSKETIVWLEANDLQSYVTLLYSELLIERNFLQPIVIAPSQAKAVFNEILGDMGLVNELNRIVDFNQMISIPELKRNDSFINFINTETVQPHESLINIVLTMINLSHYQSFPIKSTLTYDDREILLLIQTIKGFDEVKKIILERLFKAYQSEINYHILVNNKVDIIEKFLLESEPDSYAQNLPGSYETIDEIVSALESDVFKALKRSSSSDSRFFFDVDVISSALIYWFLFEKLATKHELGTIFGDSSAIDYVIDTFGSTLPGEFINFLKFSYNNLFTNIQSQPNQFYIDQYLDDVGGVRIQLEELDLKMNLSPSRKGEVIDIPEHYSGFERILVPVFQLIHPLPTP